ncbi:hypothetical protein BTO07_00620 [Polaribacter sp. SA4-12]|nr:hypothetical protein BTO07_00620 [Polaribacter sp. SA4-12]
MYKNKKTTRLETSRRSLYWLKLKLMSIITALMLGMSNSLNDEDKSIFDNQYHIEQQDKRD